MDSSDAELAAHLSRDLASTDPQTAARLLSLVYEELRRLAASVLSRQHGQSSLQPTALVHELYLRLAERAGHRWHDRTHFMAVAARAMRQIVIDHARRQRAEKRGGQWHRVTLSEAVAPLPNTDVDIVALDDVLTRLSELHERQAQIVEMRFLAGLTIEEVASVMSISPDTVKREWRMARAWLMSELAK